MCKGIYMRNKYNIFLLVFAFVFSCVFAEPASAEGSGVSCDDPIEMGRNYEGHISGPDTVWYVANTFDLPLTVTYYPGDGKAAPDLYLDFSCEPGVYEDSIICSLFCAENAIVKLPHHMTPVWKLDENNNPYYEVAMGEWYRNALLEHGISYNVEVYVKAVYYGEGDIVLTPDADFSKCLETEDWLLFDRELPVEADDDETFFIAPYANWADDSVRYIWRGAEPATVVFGTTCKFDPMDELDEHRIDVMNMKAGKDTVKHTNEDIAYYMTYMTNPDNTAKGGIFYVKVRSEGAGVLKVERIPPTPPGGDAILLKYGEKADVYSNDTSRLYAIPSSWVKNMRFTTSTDHVFRMYVGTTPDFYTTEAFATYQFDKTSNGHELRMLAAEMSSLQAHRLGSENYLYIRFLCTDNTTVKPLLWTPSDCEAKAKRIKMGQSFAVAYGSTAIYSLYHEEIKGGDLTVAWGDRRTKCAFYIADTCLISAASSRVFYTDEVPTNSSVMCSRDTIASWSQYVDPEGYIYVLFAPKGNTTANITISTNASGEEDPLCNTYDSILTVTAWDAYDWRGEHYTQSGTWEKQGTVDVETGCVDTVFTLHLTIHTTSYDELPLSGCDKVEYNNKSYTDNRQYMDTVYDAVGNRTIMTLNVTIHQSTTSDTIAVACDSLLWHEEWRKASGDYEYVTKNADGCDSIITLHLTIHHATKGDTAVTACKTFVWHGTTYTQSAEPTITLTNSHGCDSIVTLHLTIEQNCGSYDTAYFCRGFNTEHEELMAGGVIRRYRPYVFESPAEWDYMEGVIVEREHDRALVDLRRAEKNLYAHYVGQLTPISSIRWSVQYDGKGQYEPLTVTNNPQWIATGHVAVQISFLCGELYNTEFPTDIDQVSQEMVSVKRIENGRVVIIRGGAKYDMFGTKIQ